MGTLFNRACVIGLLQGSNGFKLKECRFILGVKKKRY